MRRPKPTVRALMIGVALGATPLAFVAHRLHGRRARLMTIAEAHRRVAEECRRDAALLDDAARHDRRRDLFLRLADRPWRPYPAKAIPASRGCGPPILDPVPGDPYSAAVIRALGAWEPSIGEP